MNSNGLSLKYSEMHTAVIVADNKVEPIIKSRDPIAIFSRITSSISELGLWGLVKEKTLELANHTIKNPK